MAEARGKKNREEWASESHQPSATGTHSRENSNFRLAFDGLRHLSLTLRSASLRSCISFFIQPRSFIYFPWMIIVLKHENIFSLFIIIMPSSSSFSSAKVRWSGDVIYSKTELRFGADSLLWEMSFTHWRWQCHHHYFSYHKISAIRDHFFGSASKRSTDGWWMSHEMETFPRLNFFLGFFFKTYDETMARVHVYVSMNERFHRLSHVKHGITCVEEQEEWKTTLIFPY